jgi:hypothetical protein
MIGLDLIRLSRLETEVRLDPVPTGNYPLPHPKTDPLGADQRDFGRPERAASRPTDGRPEVG